MDVLPPRQGGDVTAAAPLVGRRPTPQQLVDLEARASADANVRTMPVLRPVYIAAEFLGAVLREAGASPEQVREICFRFGRRCLGRDVWVAFDRELELWDRTVAETAELASRTVLQVVPAPTPLLEQLVNFARMSVGEEGVSPLPFLHRGASGGLSMEALAVGSGREAIDYAVRRVRACRPVEFAIAIDMVSMPGQGLRFPDFLAVVWFVEGRIVTGVVNYQRAGAVPEPAFDPIDWTNTYWNNRMRERGFWADAFLAAAEGR